VRTSKDQIIQFLYGEDGMAAEYIENLSIPLLKMDDKEMSSKYCFFDPKTDKTEKQVKLKEYVQKWAVDEIENFDGVCDKLEEEYKQIQQDRTDLREHILFAKEDIHVPVNLTRLIWNAKEMFNVKERGQTELTPDYVIEKTQKLLSDGIKVYQQ